MSHVHLCTGSAEHCGCPAACWCRLDGYTCHEAPEPELNGLVELSEAGYERLAQILEDPPEPSERLRKVMGDLQLLLSQEPRP